MIMAELTADELPFLENTTQQGLVGAISYVATRLGISWGSETAFSHDNGGGSYGPREGEITTRSACTLASKLEGFNVTGANRISLAAFETFLQVNNSPGKLVEQVYRLTVFPWLTILVSSQITPAILPPAEDAINEAYGKEPYFEGIVTVTKMGHYLTFHADSERILYLEEYRVILRWRNDTLYDRIYVFYSLGESSVIWRIVKIERAVEGVRTQPGSFMSNAWLYAAIGSFGVLAIGAALLGPEVLNLTLLSLIAPLIFRGRNPKRWGENHIRGEIRGYVVAHPGATLGEIRKALGLSYGSLGYHIWILEREGFVSLDWAGRNRRVFPTHIKVRGENGIPVSDFQLTVLEQIQDGPRTTSELSKSLNASRQRIRYNLDRLEQLAFILESDTGPLLTLNGHLLLRRRREVKKAATTMPSALSPNLPAGQDTI